MVSGGIDTGVPSVLVILILLLGFVFNPATAGTKLGFYDNSCPAAEPIVKTIVKSRMSVNPTIGAGILRLHFHDCFIRGCDASILISGPSAERTAVTNGGLRGFEVIDEAKAKVEAVCPGIVSCADVLALAARDAVSLSGGPFWPVPLGRRDGRVSSASEALNLPSPFDSVAVLKKKFSDKGLSTLDLVTLSGAHTIGETDCQFFSSRLYNFKSTGAPDPTMGEDTLSDMRKQCPSGGPGSRKVSLDVGSRDSFDESYFRNLKKNAGILESDQRLADDDSTSLFVRTFAGHITGLKGVTFKASFIKSMIEMSKIEVKTGSDGEIRKVCSSFNK